MGSVVAVFIAGEAVGCAGGMRASAGALPALPSPELAQQFAGQRHELGLAVGQRRQWPRGSGAFPAGGSAPSAKSQPQ
ncbi:jg24098, partial [Pararge aegeria aegeria]